MNKFKALVNKTQTNRLTKYYGNQIKIQNFKFGSRGLR